jgi:hypothetical protein
MEGNGLGIITLTEVVSNQLVLDMEGPVKYSESIIDRYRGNEGKSRLSDPRREGVLGCKIPRVQQQKVILEPRR